MARDMLPLAEEACSAGGTLPLGGGLFPGKQISEREPHCDLGCVCSLRLTIFYKVLRYAAKST